jgi:hypothetical protein
MSSGQWRLVLAAAIVLLSASLCRADDFFNLTAVGTSGTAVTAQGGDVIHLVDNLINEQNQFANLAGQGFTSSLTYGGVKNAAVFTENSAGTQATLNFPTTGFTKTFTATANESLETEIENFIKGNGDSAYGAFLRSMDRLSPVAVIDGNPQASTAVIADAAFSDFGIDPVAGGRRGEWRITADGGDASAAGLDGYYANFQMTSDFALCDCVSLTWSLGGQYRVMGSSESYTVDSILGLPIAIAHPQPHDGFAWEITPWGFGGLAASIDQASGDVLVGGGGTSSLAYRLGPLVFTLADQISYGGSIGVSYGDYSFDVPVEQWITKNGVDVAFAPLGGFGFIDGGVAISDFLAHAAVPDYWSPEAGVGLNLGRGSFLRVAYEGDFGQRGYKANGVNAILALKF